MDVRWPNQYEILGNNSKSEVGVLPNEHKPSEEPSNQLFLCPHNQDHDTKLQDLANEDIS